MGVTLLSVDPGVRGCGCAFWEDGVLQKAEYVRGSEDGERAEAWTTMAGAVVFWLEDCLEELGAGEIDQFVVEAPKTYKGQSSRGDTQDLLDLSAVAGALCFAVRCKRATVYYPQEHKGQLPKKIAHARALGKLTELERGRILLPSKSLAHNVLDAVQIGCSHLRRM